MHNDQEGQLDRLRVLIAANPDDGKLIDRAICVETCEWRGKQISRLQGGRSVGWMSEGTEHTIVAV